MAVLLLSTAFTRPANAAPPADPLADPPTPAWTIVPSPNISGRANRLLSVAAIAPNDVWAVGRSATTTPTASWTLTAHWDGTAWSTVSSPSPSESQSLNGVAARAANDVWSVGNFGSSSGGTVQSLILHWDGSAWSQVPSPNAGPTTTFYGVAARTSTDAWAVGNSGGAVGGDMVIAHWDGAAWNLVATPSTGALINFLTGVSALTANDAWAVGHYDLNSRFYTLLLHWDGSAWNLVPGPNVGTTTDAYLHSVTMVASNDVWAVGETEANQTYESFAIHWDGSSWSEVIVPSVGNKDFLSGVAAAGANVVWAVGRSYLAGPNLWQTLTVHKDTPFWDWTSSPNPLQATFSELAGVAAVAAGDIWAVGRSQGQGPEQTLIEHYSANTPTPTPTQTATATPTQTPTATATLCLTPAGEFLTPPASPNLQAPAETASYYVHDPGTPAPQLEDDPFYKAGQAQGIASRSWHPQSGIVILHFGDPWFKQFDPLNPTNDIWGTRLFDASAGNPEFESDRIEQAVESYALGFVNEASLGGPPWSHIVLAIGPTNRIKYESGDIYTVDQFQRHGEHWGQLVNEIANDLYSASTWITIAGANDIEFDWNDPAHTIAWTSGFESVTRSGSGQRSYYYYNYGSCDGCGFHEDPVDEPEYYNPQLGQWFRWTWWRADIVRVSWANPAAIPFPQIYYPSPPECISSQCYPNYYQARQWMYVSEYSASHLVDGRSYGKFNFIGPVSGRSNAPPNPDCCLTPENSWKSFWAWLNVDHCTTDVDLSWVTNFSAIKTLP